MPRYIVMIARIAVRGEHRQEITDVLLEANRWAGTEPRVANILHGYINKTPAPVARIGAVLAAQKHNADFLFMVDDDMIPSREFVQRSFDFLAAQPVASVVGSPYVCGPPQENVQAFFWHSKQSDTQDCLWNSEYIPRETASRLRGHQRVCNVGTGFIAYDLRVFEKISHPWYDYQYEDETHAKLTETEDCWCHRKLVAAGVPIYADFSSWSNHVKLKACGPPMELSQVDIDEVYLRQARALVLEEMRQEQEKIQVAAAPVNGTAWRDAFRTNIADAPGQAVEEVFGDEA